MAGRFRSLFGFALVPVLAAWAGPVAAAGPQPLTLAAAVSIALQHNPARAAAEGQEAGAWAALDRAQAEGYPQVRAEGRFLHLSDVPTMTLGPAAPVALGEADTWLGSVSAQQLVWAGGRVSALTRAADRNAAAATAAKTRATQQVVAGAERAFRLLLAAQDEIDAAAKNLLAAEDHLRVARDRLEARVAAQFDVLRAEVGVEEARQEAIRAAGALRVAGAVLLQALGLQEGEYRAVAPGPSGRPRPALADALEDARRRRPELTFFARRLEAADAGVAAARAERFPTLSVGADYQTVTPESNTLYTRWSAGAFASLPILDGGRIAARVGEAEAAAVQARAALEGARRQVDVEVRQAHARAETADAQVTTAAKRLEQAEELLRLAEVRYQGGVGTATEVADAQASLARARFGLTRAQAEQGIAESDLGLAIGTTPTDAPRAGEAGP